MKFQTEVVLDDPQNFCAVSMTKIFPLFFSIFMLTMFQVEGLDSIMNDTILGDLLTN